MGFLEKPAALRRGGFRMMDSFDSGGEEVAV